jgi:hypothetical protein
LFNSTAGAAEKAAEKAAAFRKWQESEQQNREAITAVSGSQGKSRTK